MEWINETTNGVALKIRAVPRASKNEIQGIHDNALKIRLTTAPVDGKANQALIKLLSNTLNISKAQIQIAQGEISRHKIVHISGLNKKQLLERLSL